MLNETASSTDDRPALRSSVRHVPHENNAVRDELRQIVMSVLMIEREIVPADDQTPAPDAHMPAELNGGLLASFEGRLLFDSEQAYDRLDKVLKPLNYLPIFREANGKHVVHILSGRVHPGVRGWTVNLFMFIATLISVLILGTLIAIGELELSDPALAAYVGENLLTQIWRGLPYALSVMLIIGAHEFGHYFAARFHKVSVTLPYFIPAPMISLSWTLGAFIQLREPIRNRKALLDIGASGPLMGFLFTIPILIIGLSTSYVGPITPGGALEGNSLVYALAKTLIFGRFLPADGIDVTINQMATAGWFGLLLTGINLLPIGQLDGGHIIYSLLGERARMLYIPVMGVLIILTLRFTEAWLLWVVLLFFFGRIYATPLDMITKLDPRRRLIGLLSIIVFIVTFIPVPIMFTSEGAGGLERQGVLLTLGVVAAANLIRGRLNRPQFRV
jgi:membrane-associated protease RseP (regulator of RpoE activity)